jgi:hypothetical protein
MEHIWVCVWMSKIVLLHRQRYVNDYKKGKAFPLQAWEWPRVFQEVKVPRFHDNGTGWWYGFQPYAQATFTPSKYTWYSFLLEAESTPGP